MEKPLSFTHRFVSATDGSTRPLLLLHGTGGNENDLLGLGQALVPGAALLSPRGKTLENGMPRFFRRLSEGVFDEQDLQARTHELVSFIAEARDAYDLQKPIVVGFSNGANIAASILMLAPEVLAGALLLRPMQPYAKVPEFTLQQTSVLMLSGAFDPIVPAENVNGLALSLTVAGACVEHETLPTGHALTQMDLAASKVWIERMQ